MKLVNFTIRESWMKLPLLYCYCTKKRVEQVHSLYSFWIVQTCSCSHRKASNFKSWTLGGISISICAVLVILANISNY